MKDYLRRGLLNSLPRHIITGMALFLFSVVGKQSPVAAVCICSFKDGLDRSDSGIQWRYLLFIGMFALELYLIVAPSSAPSGVSAYTFVDQVPLQRTLFKRVFPQRVAYQHILFLHQVFLFMSVAVSRVAPVLFGGMMQVDGEIDVEVVRAMGGRIEELTKGVERECEYACSCDADPPLMAASMPDAEYRVTRYSRRGVSPTDGESAECSGRVPDGSVDAGDGGHGGREEAEERGGSDAECMGQGSWKHTPKASCTVHFFVSTASRHHNKFTSPCGCLAEWKPVSDWLISRRVILSLILSRSVVPIWICAQHVPGEEVHFNSAPAFKTLSPLPVNLLLHHVSLEYCGRG